MAFLPSLSPEDLHHFHRVITNSVSVRTHFDMLYWLQGDMQRYIPHEILIAAWGDFDNGPVHHDIISPMAGVRSQNSNPATITPLLLQLFKRWSDMGCAPFALNAGENGFLLEDSGWHCALGDALQKMRCAIVHGIRDERGSPDCLYVAFSTRQRFSESERQTLSMVLPFIDTALRQVSHLPHQNPSAAAATPAAPVKPLAHTLDLSEREAEILCWVALGKTNPEIGSILDISEYTVKNHLQRLFKKLNVTNRAQAVSIYKSLVNHG
jgi:transcriptional regulator EpsA